MVTLEQFYRYLLPEVPGCPEPLLDTHLVEAAREFCASTSAWREDLDPIDAVAGQGAYDLDPPDSTAEILRLTRLSIGGKLLWLDVLPDHCDEEPRYDPDRPPFALDDNNASISLAPKLVPTADQPGAIALRAALRPVSRSSSLPDFLLTQHLEALRMGTLARLLQMGNRPWTDRLLALVYRSDFDQAIHRAAFRASTGNTDRKLRVRSWG